MNGGQCCSRHNKLTEMTGISKPLLMTGSTDPFVTKVIVLASNIIEKHCPWIWKGISDERQKLFAKTIHMKNKYIEACRFALYYYDLNDSDKTKQSLCTLHIDTQNGKGEDLSRVFIISKMIWEKEFTKGWRVSIICYTRHSVTSYMKRKNETVGPAVTYLINNFMEFPEMRQSVIGLKNWIFNNNMLNSLENGDFYEFNCHMNPAVHLSPVVYYTALLSFKYSLNYLEVISIIHAWAHLQWTVVYFCQGCSILLKNNKLKVRGILLGLHLFEHMKILHDKIKVSNKKSRITLQ